MMVFKCGRFLKIHDPSRHADQTARLRERGRQLRGDGVWGPASYQLQLLLGRFCFVSSDF